MHSYFVKPAGAFLGELIRHHTKAQWKKVPDQAPELVIEATDGSPLKAWPFDKIIKQVHLREKDGLSGYVQFTIMQPNL